MGIIRCTSCQANIADQLDKCPHCGHPINTDSAAPTPLPEKEIAVFKPKMFRNRPTLFIALVVITVVFITSHYPISLIAFLILMLWWLKYWNIQLTITDKRTILRQGILTKTTSEVRHADIRNILCRQNLEQRIFGVGTLGISSAAQAGLEIVVPGILAPHSVIELIRQLQSDSASDE